VSGVQRVLLTETVNFSFARKKFPFSWNHPSGHYFTWDHPFVNYLFFGENRKEEARKKERKKERTAG
jgi:hypothetical protein